MLLHRLTCLWPQQRTSWGNAPVVAARPPKRVYCRTRKGAEEQDAQLVTCRSSVSSVQQLERQQAQPQLTSALEAWARPLGQEPASHGPHQLLQRPVICRPDTTGATGVSPLQLAGLAAVLKMPIKQLQVVLHDFPQLAHATPEHLEAQLTAIQIELGLSHHEVKLMVTHHADMVLEVPPAQLTARAHALAAQLGLKPADVLSVCGSIPSILKRSPDQLAKHLKAVGQTLGGVPMRSVLKLAAAAPQLLTATPNCVRQRLAKLSYALRKPPKLVVKMLHLQADLLFISPRVLKNKISVLQCILNRPLRLVLPIAMACPQLMRTNLDAVRAAYAALLPISGRDTGFTFGMVLLGQARHVHLAARQEPHWQAQIKKFNPAQVADCLGLTAPTYARLNFMLATGKADELSLHAILTLPRAVFLQRYPDSSQLMHIRRQERSLAPIPKWEPPAKSTSGSTDGWGLQQAGQTGGVNRQRSRRRQQYHQHHVADEGSEHQMHSQGEIARGVQVHPYNRQYNQEQYQQQVWPAEGGGVLPSDHQQVQIVVPGGWDAATQQVEMSGPYEHVLGSGNGHVRQGDAAQLPQQVVLQPGEQGGPAGLEDVHELHSPGRPVLPVLSNGYIPDEQPQHVDDASTWVVDHVQHVAAQQLAVPVQRQQHHAVRGHRVALTGHTQSLQALAHVGHVAAGHHAATDPPPIPPPGKRSVSRRRSPQQFQQPPGLELHEQTQDSAAAASSSYDSQQESEGEGDLQVMSLGSTGHAGSSTSQVSRRQGVLTRT